MSKRTIVIVMVLVNIFLGVLFVASNYFIWDNVNAQHYASPYWNPIKISYVPRDYVNGEWIYVQTVIVLSNYPFWLFWVDMIANISFGIMLLRNKETKQTPSQSNNDKNN